MRFKVASEIGQRLADKIKQDEASTRCGRVDMKLADFRMEGDNEATIMVEYSKERGAPSALQLNEWVTAAGNARFLLTPETIRDHKDIGAFVAMVREVNTPMSVARVAQMAPVGMNRYADAAGNHWERRKTEDGDEYLARVISDDMPKILEEMRNREAAGRYAKLSLDMVRTAGTATLESGDTVAYTTPDGGSMQQFGKVTGLGTDWVTVEGYTGKLSRSYVFDIVQKSAASIKKQNAFLTQFWTDNLFAGDASLGNKMKIQ